MIFIQLLIACVTTTLSSMSGRFLVCRSGPRTLTQVLITNTLYFKPIRPARNMPSDSNVNGTKHLKWPISFWNMTLDYRILTDNAPTPGNIVWPSAYENYDWEDGHNNQQVNYACGVLSMCCKTRSVLLLLFMLSHIKTCPLGSVLCYKC